MSASHSIAQGLAVPSLKTLRDFHPQFALAIQSGVPCRPDVRPVSVEFDSSAQVGSFEDASFAELISTYSVFAGIDITIDPTNAFPGNPLKYLSDVLQPRVSGLTFTLVVTGRGGNYAPCTEPTPMQSVPIAFSAAAGIWSMDNPENIKARWTLASLPNGSPDPAFPFTVTMTFAFLVLGPDGSKFMCLDAHKARCELAKFDAQCWEYANQGRQPPAPAT